MVDCGLAVVHRQQNFYKKVNKFAKISYKFVRKIKLKIIQGN
jgi:hypothetical protein